MNRRLISALLWLVPPALLIGLGVTAYFTRNTWQAWLPQREAEADDHAEEGHAHDHGAIDSIVLSERARDNLGLEIGTVSLGDYWRKLPIPGEVVERPGRSNLALTTRTNGLIDEVQVLPGQAVRPGDILFKIQLTGDEAIQTQSDLVNAIQQMKINQAEMKRIKPLVPDSVPEEDLLKLEYEQQLLRVRRDLARQELRTHGFTEEQVQQVSQGSNLIRELIIRAPEAVGPALEEKSTSTTSSTPREVVYTVESIDVYPGRLVKAGDHLGQLAAHDTLLVRGHAFERESDAVERAMKNQWPVDVEFVVGEEEKLTRRGLSILYGENVVARGSRTLEFFLPLPNEIVSKRPGPEGGEYLTWRFKPGQQARLFVPVQRWGGDPKHPESDVIVLPTLAVTEEGPDAFAFVINGRKLERRGVRVLHRDSGNVVLANDGALFPGEKVALNNAYQLNLALKKKQGGGAADPHAGHMH